MILDDRQLLHDLRGWLRIPSCASEERALRDAAEWACERIDAAGGEARVVDGLVVGELRSGRADAPTVLIYGHYDVQDVGDPRDWLSDPFEPVVREGRVYARGASDDKGNFLPLLAVACALARAGDLGAHVRVLIDGEEEVGGSGAPRWVAADEQPIDCAIVYDSWMLDERTPALTIGLRGFVQAHIEVRTGAFELHSGVYGGSVLNATHVLHAMLANVLPDARGAVPEPLRAGLEAPGDAERRAWGELPPGDAEIAAAGAHPLHADSGRDFFHRSWAASSLDVNELRAGAARTIVPATAHATVTQRLAPAQRADVVAAAMRELLLSAVPEGATATVAFEQSDPVLFSVDEPAIRLAAAATTRATGMTTRLVRWGGTIPVVAALARRGVPTVVGGFGLPADAPHAPNESFRLESLRLGRETAGALYAALSTLRGAS